MNSQNYLDAFYRNYDEENRLRSKCGMVEFITTMHFLKRFLKPENQFLRLAQALEDTAMSWPRKDIVWMPLN